MFIPNAQGGRTAAVPSRRLARRIGGVALMLIGVALMAWGAHHLTENGNCSSTGYVSYGPVPTCKGNEFLYITSAFFLGPAVAGVGWLMAGISGLMWPLTCVGYAVAFITIRNDVSPSPGAKAFGLLSGYFFIALAVLSVVITLRKRHRKKTAPTGVLNVATPHSAGPAPAGPAAAPMTSAPPSWGAPVTQAGAGSGPDPFDKIAKLAQLHQAGAITDAEFEREKAKLLGEI